MPTIPEIDLFTGTETLGKVYCVDNQLNLKYFDFNVPLQDSSKHTNWQVLGKKRILTLQGSHDGTGFSGATDDLKVRDFVETMDTWANASVSATQVFTDAFGIDYEVSPVDWRWRHSFDKPGRIIYSLIMMEGALNPLA